MRPIVFYVIFATVVVFSCSPKGNQSVPQITKANLTYDFSFAELSVKYLETEDPNYLNQIAELEATKHLQNHATYFNNNIPKSPKIELVKYLLSPVKEKKKICYTQRNKLPEMTCLKRNV